MKVAQFKIGLIIIASTLLLSACKTETTTPSRDTSHESMPATAQLNQNPTESMATLLNEIRATAGVARAENPNQCKLLPIGQRPCGGPERFILYSTATADEAKLNELARRYNALAAQRNEEEGLMSTCEVLTPPRITVSGGLCVIAEMATH